MNTQTRVKITSWLRPLGDSPAVNFLRDSPAPPDGKTSRILSLACGDPRSIFFTLWSNQATIENRSFSFTCCDIEPTILARNVVLFTLVADGVQDDVVWSLFYHLYIPSASLKVLESHCGNLVQASVSLESWMASKYANILRWVDKDTLSRLRSYWLRYHRMHPDQEANARTYIRRRFERMAERRNMWVTPVAHAAGPQRSPSMTISGHYHLKFWETGVAGGNRADLESLSSPNKSRVNPLFFVSSTFYQAFGLNYCTDPLAGFHLAKVRQQISGDLQPQAAVDIAKSQFRQWSQCFKRYADADKVHINMFCGDALALCHFLQSNQLGDFHKKLPSTYKLPFSATPLHLDGNAARDQHGSFLLMDFDVIDSSIIGDHVGLVNLLCTTAPLLKQVSNSTLYTESRRMIKDGISDPLSKHLGADITTFSLLIRLIPLGFLTEITIDASSSEAIFSTSGGARLRRQQQRIPWKSTVGCRTTSVKVPNDEIMRIEAQVLAQFLFSLYQAMFHHEYLPEIVSFSRNDEEGRPPYDPPTHVSATMVALIRFLKTRIHTDWEQMVEILLVLVESYDDQDLDVCRHGLQELKLHMHLGGVCIKGPLARPALEVARSLGSVSRPIAGFLARENLPNVSTLVLMVPRDALRTFIRKQIARMSSPALRIVISQREESQFSHSFFSCFACFGRITYDSSSAHARLQEDTTEGWNGEAELVVMCAIPTYILLLGRRETLDVALKLHGKLDKLHYSDPFFERPIFEANLDDRKRCFVCRDFPKLKYLSSTSASSGAAHGSRISHVSDGLATLLMNHEQKATHLHRRICYPVECLQSQGLLADAEALLMRALQTDMKVRSALLNLKEWWPFIRTKGSSQNIEIKHKSSWFEFSVALFDTIPSNGYHDWTQMLLTDRHPPYSPYMPRIDLDLLPCVPLDIRQRSLWIRPFMDTTFSDKEYNAKGSAHAINENLQYGLKKTIAEIFMTFAGLTDVVHRIPNIGLAHDGKVHTLIFATNLRSDLDLRSLVLDAYVVPLTIERESTLQDALSKLSRTNAGTIDISKEQTELWKLLLPSLAERCRTWSHKATCEYKTLHRCPLSIEISENPMCSCGEGQISASKLVKLGGELTEWRRRAFAKYAVRIAIPAIHPVSYLEPSFPTVRKTLLLQGCDYCGAKEDEMWKCLVCKQAKYCSPECRDNAWVTHELACVQR